MPKRLPFLLLSLLFLVAAACSTKKDPAPSAPSLPGTWTVQYVETNEYNADGSERAKSGLVAQPQPYNYTFTASQLSIKAPGFTAALDYTYTHNNTTLTLVPAGSTPFSVPFDQTVVSLSQHSLVLRDERGPTQGARTVTIFHMAR